MEFSNLVNKCWIHLNIEYALRVNAGLFAWLNALRPTTSKKCTDFYTIILLIGDTLLLIRLCKSFVDMV
jgi:hypothetical protein